MIRKPLLISGANLFLLHTSNLSLHKLDFPALLGDRNAPLLVERNSSGMDDCRSEDAKTRDMSFEDIRGRIEDKFGLTSP